MCIYCQHAVVAKVQHSVVQDQMASNVKQNRKVVFGIFSL